MAGRHRRPGRSAVNGTPPPGTQRPPLGPAPITEAMRAHARAHPNEELYVIDPEIDPDGDVPGWAIRGYYPVNAAGDIDAPGWTANPNYRPGPLTLDFPRPTNRVDRALQLVATGYQPLSLLLAALATAQVVIPTTPEEPDAIPVLDEHDMPGPGDHPAADHGADQHGVGDGAGQGVVAVFTAPRYLHPDTPRQVVAVRDLLPLLPTVTVLVNPGLRPSLRLPGADLAAVAASTTIPAPSTRPNGTTP